MKLVIAITGASGTVYAQKLIEALVLLREQVTTCDIIFSNCGKQVWEYELPNYSLQNIPFKIYEANNFMAPFASGSAGYDAMIICPCTMGTMGRIASGVSNDLITRTADVLLKERKKLILAIREMPYNLIHIENMKTITLAGGIICPASPSFYSLPQTTDAIIYTVIEKILLLTELKVEHFKWGSSH